MRHLPPERASIITGIGSGMLRRRPPVASRMVNAYRWPKSKTSYFLRTLLANNERSGSAKSLIFKPLCFVAYFIEDCLSTDELSQLMSAG